MEVGSIKFNEQELLKAVKDLKAGDKTALEVLYKLTYKKVYFFSLSITKDSEMTSDVVQEVYLSVFNSISSLKDEKLFIAWLNRITYNATMKELSKSNKRPINIPDEELHVKLVDENNPMIRYIENESTKELMKCILGLKEKYRTVLILKYFNHYKIKEMAEILNCPEGTVKSRLNTAKEELKKELNKNHNKIIVSVFFSFMISSTLMKSAEASVAGDTNINSQSLSNSIGSSSIINIGISLLVLATVIPVCVFIASDKEDENIERSIYAEYNKSFTNEDIEVIITIENLGSKDSISVISFNNESLTLNKVSNKTFSFIAKSNGSYTIKISDNKGNQDTVKEINIDNIDKVAPVIKSSSKNENILEIVLSDNLSGINYDKIELTLEDNSKVNLVDIDKNNNKVSIELNEEVFYLKIYDNVGNYSIQKIEVE